MGGKEKKMVVAEVQYTDLFMISIIPIIIQGVAGFYVFKLHNILGRCASLLFAGINILMFWFDVTVAYILFSPEPQILHSESIGEFGIFIGFIVPMGIAILLFILQKQLRDSLMPIMGGSKEKEKK